MCEFKVYLDGRLVFEDVVYAKEEGEKVILRDILGESREMDGCRIMEVDVASTRILLAKK